MVVQSPLSNSDATLNRKLKFTHIYRAHQLQSLQHIVHVPPGHQIRFDILHTNIYEVPDAVPERLPALAIYKECLVSTLCGDLVIDGLSCTGEYGEDYLIVCRRTAGDEPVEGYVGVGDLFIVGELSVF